MTVIAADAADAGDAFVLGDRNPDQEGAAPARRRS